MIESRTYAELQKVCGRDYFGKTENRPLSHTFNPFFLYARINKIAKTAMFAAITNKGLIKPAEKSFTITFICCVYRKLPNLSIVSLKFATIGVKPTITAAGIPS